MTSPTGRREIEGWWMRPCWYCHGRHMDKDCPRPTPPGAAAKVTAAPPKPGKAKGKSKSKAKSSGMCTRCGKQGHRAAGCRGVMALENESVNCMAEVMSTTTLSSNAG
eukprot:14281653-Heterocapsa_arctica.AAC.1